jgi:hypothetical protein
MIPAVRNTILGGIVAIAALTGQAQGDEHFFGYPPSGAGSERCGQFLQAADGEHQARPRNADPTKLYTRGYTLYVVYALGFLTGASAEAELLAEARAAEAGAGRLASKAGQAGLSTGYFASEMVFLENYCRQHPLDNYMDALIDLRTALLAKGLQ